MNESSNETFRASLRNGAMLALFALVSTGLIAIIHGLTKDKISQEVEAAMARRLNEIVSSDQYDNDVYHDCIQVTADPLLGPQADTKFYRMRLSARNYGVFFTAVAPDGYSGKIKLVVGVYADGTLAGVRVSEHQETPGLGDKIEIEKSDWIKQFSGKSLDNLDSQLWKVKKDGGEFDALTGATITPRAVVKSVYNALVYYQKNQSKLYVQLEHDDIAPDSDSANIKSCGGA